MEKKIIKNPEVVELVAEVESSVINKIVYNEKTKELYIVFKNKHIYKYKEVPIEIIKEFISAESKGKYFNKKLKKKYLEVKII